MNKKPRATREKKEVFGSGTNRAAPGKGLDWMWWRAGVAAAKIHLGDPIEDDWDSIPAGDKAFMRAAAENLIAALETAKRSAKPVGRSRPSPQKSSPRRPKK